MRSRNRFIRGQILLALSLLILHLSAAISDAIEFEFLYTDPAGQGFFNPVDGAQRRTAMNFAGDIIGQLIRPTYADEVVTVRVNSYSSTTDNLWAFATPAYYYGDFGSSDPRYQSGTNYAKALASHLLGNEIQGDQDDITLSVNSANTFYWGTDGKSTFGAGDFVSIAMHEIIHGLGFADSFRAQGGYGLFGDGTYDSQDGVSGLPLAYDRFLTVGPGGAPLISLNSASRSSALISNNIYWSGANAIAGNGGTAPKIYAPNPFKGGASITHLDNATYPNDPMNSGISAGQIKQTPSAIDRGILRDLGWDISVSSATVTWTGAGTDNHLSNFANLSQQPFPGDALRFTNNAAGAFDVRMDLPLYQLERITFTVPAPTYTLRIDPTVGYDLTGFGVENQTPLVHNFILESQVDEVSPNSTGEAAYIGFRNSATSSNSSFDLHGGYSVPEHTPTNFYKRFSGAQVNFYDTSTAANSTFTIHGAAGDGAPGVYGSVNFHGTSAAASATFTNQPGIQGQDLDGHLVVGFGGHTFFLDSATAATATIHNLGQSSASPGGSDGVTAFRDISTAGSSSIHNFGATNGSSVGAGGSTQFYDHSTAGLSSIVNDISTFSFGGGNTYFGDDSVAGNATITNLGTVSLNGPGTTTFDVRSSADHALIFNQGLDGGGNGGVASLTSFLGQSSAGSATIRNLAAHDTGGRTEFRTIATAANAHITLEPGGSGGTITFFDNSTADHAFLDASATNAFGQIAFRGQSTAANSVITLGDNNSNGLNAVFTDSSTAASATINVGAGSNLQFLSSSSAVSANVTLASNGRLLFSGLTSGNSTFHLIGGATGLFSGGASAGTSSFTVDGSASAAIGGAVLAFNGADPSTATIYLNSPTAPGGLGPTLNLNTSAGPLARVITQANTLIYVVPNDATELGSVDGAGGISLGSCILTLGGLGITNTISGNITGFDIGGITKTGPANLTLSGHNSYKGLTSVLQGTLVIAGPNSLPGPYFVAPGAHIVFGTHVSATSLTGTGTYTLNAPITVVPGSGLSILNSLMLGPGGSLDLADNSLKISTATTPASTIVGYLKSSFNSGLWNGVGINSSAAHNNATSLTALGYLDDGANVTIKYTYYGDSNLDGIVNAADFQMLLNGLVDANAGSWTQGDYTYDGRVDLGNDFNLFLVGYLNQGNALGDLAPIVAGDSNLSANQKARLLALVPEPSLGLIPLAALIGARRRRR